MNQKYFKLIFLVLFLLGLSIRSLDVWRPVDGSVSELWRECDYASIARNYYREDMNIFYPRIDWRGDGPGYAEMEFPIFPWTVAVIYKVFGYKEALGRILSLIISLISLLIFFRLALYLLHPMSAFVASLLFTLNPLLVRVSTSLQPEGLMLLFYICAVYAFLLWLDRDSMKWYSIAVLSTAAAIIVKPNAAHIGFLFLALLINTKGTGSFKRVSTWIFPILALGPAVLWYVHAHNLWLTYGNSLGVSNEYHWVGWDIFTNPTFIYGLVKNELLNVWAAFGGIAAVIIILKNKTDKTVKLCIFWFSAILIYFIFTIRTTSDSWAYYYHIVSVPPAALLLGAGFDYVRKNIHKQKMLISTTVISIPIALGFIFLKYLDLVRYQTTFVVSIVISLILAIFAFGYAEETRKSLSAKQAVLSIVILFGIFSTLLFYGLKTSQYLHPKTYQVKYSCAEAFRPIITEDALIIASGGTMFDDTGFPVAYNAPYYFFWLDRKGFNIPFQQQSLKKVKELIDRGARYYVLEKAAAQFTEGFKEQLEQEYTILDECEDAYLIRLAEVDGP